MKLTLERTFFFILLGLTTLAFIGVLQVFLIPLFWAVTFAILFEPLLSRLLKIMPKMPTLAVTLTLLAIIALVLVPLLSLGAALTGEIANLVRAIENGEFDLSPVLNWVNANAPTLVSSAEELGVDVESIRSSLSGGALAAGRWLAANALQIGQNAVNLLIGIALMLYVLFFFPARWARVA